MRILEVAHRLHKVNGQNHTMSFRGIKQSDTLQKNKEEVYKPQI